LSLAASRSGVCAFLVSSRVAKDEFTVRLQGLLPSWSSFTQGRGLASLVVDALLVFHPLQGSSFFVLRSPRLDQSRVWYLYHVAGSLELSSKKLATHLTVWFVTTTLAGYRCSPCNLLRDVSPRASLQSAPLLASLRQLPRPSSSGHRDIPRGSSLLPLLGGYVATFGAAALHVFTDSSHDASVRFGFGGSHHLCFFTSSPCGADAFCVEPLQSPHRPSPLSALLLF
jgi:hypothetical protein